MKNALKNAKFITTEFHPFFSEGEASWGRKGDYLSQHTELEAGDGLPFFFKDFDLKKPGKAKLYFTALGCCDIYINGSLVGNEEMKPGWSDYNTRTLYTSFDVSAMLKKGKNRILAVAAPGWYCGRIAGGYYGGTRPAFAASLVVDGKEFLVTDGTWSSALGGETRFSDIWDGEFTDARQPSYAGMSAAGAAVKGKKKTEIFDYPGEVTEFIGPAVKVRKGLTLSPASLTVTDGIEYNGSYFGKVHIAEENAALPLTLKKGQKLTVDFGVEIVGRIRLKMNSVKGNELKVRYAEFLNDSGELTRGNDGPEGSVYTVNLRSALGKEQYVFGGKEEVDFAPRFTFYGFRYAEISAHRDVTISSITGEVIGNDTKETGTLETSDADVNKLISNIIRGQRGNYLSVPTDCPQRDERLGWTGDAQAFSVTAAYNADVYGFFRKWMQDMRDSQSESGGYADVNPRVGCCHSEDACAWGDAGIIIPYNMYRMFGNKKILEEHYGSMEKYIAGLVEKYGMSGPIPRYGDWLAYDWCDNKFISSAYFVHDLDMMIYMSNVLGKEDRAVHYASLRKKAHDYFKKNFMKRGRLIEQTQTNKIISLAFDLLDEKYALQVADELEKQIADNGDRLSCGFLGTYNLCPALSKFGKDKTAYNLLLQHKEPSWLYSVDQGATTIWERWNSYTKAKGFGDVGMNSFNHYAYGAIGEWMYRFMAGIEAEEPGFGKIKLQPRIDLRTADELPEGQKNITFVKASFKSPAGLIRSEWSTENGFVYRCTVPEGAEAQLILPELGKKPVKNGKTMTAKQYVSEGGFVRIILTGGKYEFTFKK